MSSQKIGFWSVCSLVVGSQIGSGILMSPANLAPYGYWAFLGWVISGLGAIVLALVFAQLCMRIPKTGGPHTYVKKALGSTASFFVAWTYWVISWVSTTAVVTAAIGYLTPLIGDHGPWVNLMLEIALLLLITVLNIRGVHVAGRAEFILSNLKILPLVILPLVGIFAFQDQHIVCSVSDTLPTKDIIVQVIILTFWGFIGLECATTPAGSIDNPTKTIPKAVVTGTLFVALLYMLNSAGIMGIMPAQTLAQSQAPYADAAHLLFGKGWNLVISLLAFIVCVGTLNAWMLTSGQIALGASEDGLFPKALGRTNRTQSPQTALIISALGIIPLLILTTDHSLAQSIHHIINISVTAFLFVYGMCVLSFLLISYQESPNHAFKHVLLGGLALLFCLGLVFTTEPKMLLYSSFFTLSGIPAYLWMRKKSSV